MSLIYQLSLQFPNAFSQDDDHDHGEINAPCLNVQLFCANFPKPNLGSFEFIQIFSGELGLISFCDRVIRLFIPEFRIVKFPENRGPMRGGGVGGRSSKGI